MQIKKFRANDTAEALRLIRKEFGSRAVILSSKDVEIGSGVFGLKKKYCVEVTAATDAETPKPAQAPAIGFKRRIFRKSDHENSVAPILLKKSKRITPSSQEMGANRIGKIKPLKMRNGFSRKSDHRMRFFSLYKELQDRGVKEHIAMDLVKALGRFPSLKKSFSEDDLRHGVKEILRKMGAATNPIGVARGEQKIAAMVGASGVGKTSMIAKLAGMGGLKQGRKMGIITLDDRKIGAFEELQIYSRIFDVPMAAASTKSGLEQSLHRFRNKDIILIDTPGISRNEKMLFRKVQDLLRIIRSLEIQLVVSATTRRKDFNLMVDRFKPMNVKNLIFTRLDDVTEYGDIINYLIETGIPASYFSNGAQVPENIEVATLDRLVKWVLKRNHARQSPPLATPRVDKGNRQMTYGPYLEESYAYS